MIQVEGESKAFLMIRVSILEYFSNLRAVCFPACLLHCSLSMENSSAVKTINERVSKLAAKYARNPNAEGLSDELDQFTMLRDTLKEIEIKATIQPHDEIALLRGKLEMAARKIVEMRFEDPQRHDVANDIAALLMLAHSINRQAR